MGEGIEDWGQRSCCMGKSTEGLAVWDTCQAGLSTKWTAEGYFSFHNFNLEF